MTRRKKQPPQQPRRVSKSVIVTGVSNLPSQQSPFPAEVRMPSMSRAISTGEHVRVVRDRGRSGR